MSDLQERAPRPPLSRNLRVLAANHGPIHGRPPSPKVSDFVILLNFNTAAEIALANLIGDSNQFSHWPCNRVDNDDHSYDAHYQNQG